MCHRLLCFVYCRALFLVPSRLARFACVCVFCAFLCLFLVCFLYADRACPLSLHSCTHITNTRLPPCIQWSSDSMYVLCANLQRAMVEVFSVEDPEWHCHIDEVCCDGKTFFSEGFPCCQSSFFSHGTSIGCCRARSSPLGT